MLNREDTRDFYTLCMDPDNFQPATLKARNPGNAQATFTDYALPRVRMKAQRKSITTDGLGRVSKIVNYVQVWRDSLESSTPPGCPAPKATDIFVLANGDQYTIVPSAENTLAQNSVGSGNVFNCEVLKVTS